MKKISRRTFVATTGAALAGGMTHAFHGIGAVIDRAKRSSPAEGLKRENIVITDIKVTPLSYQHDGEYLWRCAGLYVWKTDAALVQVFTNKGIVGIAEGSPYRGPDNLKVYTDKFITPLLKGENVFDVDFLTNNQGHNSLAEGAWAGVNNAIWDIIGKATGEPVYKLLSNHLNPSNKVKIYASGGVSHAWYDKGEEDLINEALRYKEAGYDTFKFRNGTSWKYSGMTMDKYIPILERLRKAVGPDFKLVIEKFPWEFETIINVLCPVLEDLKFYWYEEPVSHTDPAALEQHIAINEAMPSVMVSGGESWWNRYQVQPFVAAKAMNIIQTDANLTGITEGWHIGQTISEYGQYYCPHNWVGGLTTIANIHLVAGVPSGHMCELNQTYNPLKWDIFKEPYPIKNGVLTIPDKPGFGVELIDDIEKKFPWVPGPYYKRNPRFEGTDLPLWWS
ncbi:MAG: mandelate racemase/muconate lactonizing enzyme family protein [Cyclobacteriaceae bacterium]|nr:mandelate racemase/muconate lactonizing enzyme family protein [Cyclobacteriaceae bacterium]MDH5249095.1 mandelate racemase/muconate lactonizing enzyme family protein [Cyclobacteriaceae bacterium]